ncbi:MAG: UDP-N-acetylmuramate dehydrogenase [Pseudomonadota bacterium]
MIERDASLRGMNSFGVPARAAGLARLHDLDALPALLDDPGWRDRPLLWLGGGSTVLFTGDFDGLVLRIEAERIAHSRWDGDDTMVRVEAGRDWHDFVRWTLDAGHPGLENLSLIPGTVGAAPIQNIGAYGVEVESCIEAVEAWDRRARAFVALDRAACGFAYRDSVFKREPGRWIVTAVRFRFPPAWTPVLRYPGVREELAAQGVAAPTPQAVSEAICAIRRRKLPDPARLGNAGSFFKNPIVPAAQAQALADTHPGLPAWPAGDGRRKLSAAWLIEQAGLKGLREGDAGVSPQHALVLVNHGGATGAQVLDLARRVQAAVVARFQVTLEPEPLIL